MTPLIHSQTIDLMLPSELLFGLLIWTLLTGVGWFLIQKLNLKTSTTRWSGILLSALFFVILVDIPLPLILFVGAVLTTFIIWALHTVPISFALGFYFRHKLAQFTPQAARIQGYGRIYSVGILSIVIQKDDLSEHALSYTELLQKGLQISDSPPINEWQITLSDPLSPEAIRVFDRRLSNMAWFSTRTAPSIWPQANRSNTLIIRATLLRERDYARVIQIFHRELRNLSKEYPLS